MYNDEFKELKSLIIIFRIDAVVLVMMIHSMMKIFIVNSILGKY
ncbi:hypothetical protein [Metabacillus endolithicus]|nr:hypothetical protein [Metabacillus endolithicus]